MNASPLNIAVVGGGVGQRLREEGRAVDARTSELGGALAIFDQWGANVGPSAIHEGMADYWAGTTIGNALVGEYGLGRLGQPRDMDNTLTCPGSIMVARQIANRVSRPGNRKRAKP